MRDDLNALFSQTISEAGDQGALETLAHDEGINYLPWRSAEFAFDQI